MVSTLADHWLALRLEGFVGREEAIARIGAVIGGPAGPDTAPGGGHPRVAWVHGPAGVGKSMLLRQALSAHARPRQRHLWIDATALGPAPRDLLDALRERLPTPAGQPFAGDTIYVIDSLDERPGLGRFAHDVLLGLLPTDARLLLASRRPPGAVWRADPAAATQLEVVGLGALTEAEAEALLARAGVRDPAVARALHAMTHGHPLGLSLCASVPDPAALLDAGLSARPDLVEALVAHLFAEVPSPRHHDALAVAGIARRTTEESLCRVLEAPADGEADCTALFGWLLAHGCTDVDADGVFLHGLARDTLRADHAFRRRPRTIELAERVQAHALDALHRAPSAAAVQTVLDLMCQHWTEPELAHGVAPPRLGEARRGTATDADIVRETVRRWEGEAAAEHVARWLAAAAEGRVDFDVLCGDDGAVEAWALWCDLDRLEVAEVASDPALVASRAALARTSRRGGTRALLLRSWGVVGRGQERPADAARIFLLTAAVLAREPAIELVFGVYQAPERYGPYLAAAYSSVVERFDLGDSPYGIIRMDLRVHGLAAWLGRQMSGAPAARGAAVEPTLLDRAAFGDAVREALRAMAAGASLRASPLVAAPFVLRALGGGEAAEDALARLLRAACREAPVGDERERGALRATYVEPAVKQRAAAYDLGMAYSTYRRMLYAGVDAVVEHLWALDRGAAPGVTAAGGHPR